MLRGHPGANVFDQQAAVASSDASRPPEERPVAMDIAREIELIHTIDEEVRRLLEHAGDLAGAGKERPLLVILGQTLRQQLEQLRSMIGPLAALLPPAARSPGAAAPADRTAVTNSGRRRVAGRAKGGATAVRVVRLPPHRPRVRFRRARLVLPAGETAAAEPFQPLHVLRKAGAIQEPESAVPPAVPEREQLRRLGEFFEATPEPD